MPAITLLGGQHPVVVPSVGVSEALLLAVGAAYPDSRGVWALAACIGACGGAGLSPRGVSLATCRMDVLVYGEAIYSHLRERGVQASAIVAAATPLLTIISERVAPVTEEEVQAQVGFSDAAAGG